MAAKNDQNTGGHVFKISVEFGGGTFKVQPGNLNLRRNPAGPPRLQNFQHSRDGYHLSGWYSRQLSRRLFA